jgi:hypothetical protein
VWTRRKLTMFPPSLGPGLPDKLVCDRFAFYALVPVGGSYVGFCATINAARFVFTPLLAGDAGLPC